ncbi:cysteine--tRNA ligase [Methanolobus halotolerans]|uniref:Cysteine--tRNA ligase n=1 Tax=Methanolobus halotolerans TaxID=2052935 RepID=A0A4E0QCT6_9EURY|nr:cysteine--tRNA ligase [Methanolobus halotolerans]TGC11067.1 cysteine--tRNA ligase [Methanolobus halotolerans]
MVLRVYNTLTRQMEDFVPLHDMKVNMYVCGPTVYDHCHLGHARSYISFDVIRRYLGYRKYDVRYVSNITDVDDKIINRAREIGVDPFELSSRFALSFIEDMDRLNVVRPDIQPLVTDHIPEIIGMIEGLIDRGLAYPTQVGNVYYDLTSSLGRVGILSHQTVEGLLEGSGSRVEVEEDKNYRLDFVLWKSSSPDEPGWESPWGRGRPGWHIECSVMSRKYGSQQLDIHGGGVDLIFPHHEAEILQSEGYTGLQPFSKYWMHNGFLTIDQEKMSKSLGNFFTIKQVLEEFPPEVIRFFILNTHYRNTIDFSEKHLEEAGRAYERIANTIVNLKFALKEAPDKDSDHGLSEQVRQARDSFITSMDEDFNTREALANLFVFARRVNAIISANGPDKKSLRKVLDFFSEIDEVLGVFRKEMAVGEKIAEGPSDEEIEELIHQREKSRKAKDWARADAIRDELQDKGIFIEDGKEGVRWRRT